MKFRTDILHVVETYSGCYFGNVEDFNCIVMNKLCTGQAHIQPETKNYIPISPFDGHNTWNDEVTLIVLPDNWMPKIWLPKYMWTALLISDALTENGSAECGSQLLLTGFVSIQEDVFGSIKEHVDALGWDKYAVNFDF